MNKAMISANIREPESNGGVLTEQQYGTAFSAGYKRTVRFLLKTGVKGDMAEEIAQAAWVRGWERRSQLKSAAAINVWVNTIAHNLLRANFRQQKPTEELMEGTVVEHPQFESRVVNEILACCSPLDQELIKQHYIEGWTSNEIGPRMGMSPVTVRVRLLRMKANLRSNFGLRTRSIPEAA